MKTIQKLKVTIKAKVELLNCSAENPMIKINGTYVDKVVDFEEFLEKMDANILAQIMVSYGAKILELDNVKGAQYIADRYCEALKAVTNKEAFTIQMKF
jgi:hypothetical protein